jgi:hypothetical protein
LVTFDEREKERAEEKYAQLVSWAEIENACYDHARELADQLRVYLANKHVDVALSSHGNEVTLARGSRTLVISTNDHRMYEVARPGSNDPREATRKKSLSRLDERRMTDEVLEWLS